MGVLDEDVSTFTRAERPTSLDWDARDIFECILVIRREVVYCDRMESLMKLDDFQRLKL